MNIDKIRSNSGITGQGRIIQFESTIDSTHAWAARSNSKKGDVFLADFQSAGYGRLKRPWESPSGKNILMTLVDEAPVDPAKVPQITLVAGVAFAKALKSFGLPILLKWPNDLFVSKRKIGGILCESDGGLIRVGVGININSTPADYSEDLRPLLTSTFRELGHELQREEVVAVCLNEYESARHVFDTQGIEPILAEWKKLTLAEGTKILVNEGGETVEAIYRGITRDGFLLAQIGDKIETVISGDVRLL